LFDGVKSDSSSHQTQPNIAVAEAGSVDAGTRYWLDHHGRRFDVGAQPIVIGRSAVCQLVLDDALVSRRHAQVLLLDDAAVVEDLESVNGVYVNGERVERRRELNVGDRLVIGKQEMIVHGRSRTAAPAARTMRFNAETLTGVDAQPLGTRPTLTDPMEEDATHQGDALDLLGGVADKVLALGRGEEAEKILSAYLVNMIDSAARGTVDPAMAEKAAEYGVKLAGATGKGSWVDYVFDLYKPMKRPLPGHVVDELYTVLRRVSGINLAGLRAYVAILREAREKFGPADRFLTQRIEGLERLASAR
jgi:pSer/pThr/pTyr-binding forkhead associated (FHA) protein